MKKITWLYLILLVVFSSAATFLFVGSTPNMENLKNSVAPAASLYPQAKSASEQLHFIDDNSEDTHLSEVTDGKWALLYFGYTSCPDVCPIDLSKINLTHQLMTNRDSLQVVFISVDPVRDLGNLDKFASAFNPSFVGLTAPQEELMAISKSLGVYHEVVQTQALAQEDHSNHGDHGEHSSDHANFKAHEMINPENGDVHKVENHERHMELMKLGYVHHGHDMATNKDSHDSHEMVADDEHSSTEMAHYDIDHTSSYLLFSPDLKLTALLTSPHEPPAMAKAIDQIIESLR